MRQPHALGALASALLTEDDEPRSRYHLLEETLVVAHHQLAVYLLHGLERHSDADEQRRARERDRGYVPDREEDRRRQRHRRKEEASRQGDPVEDPREVVLGRGARPEPRDVP